MVSETHLRMIQERIDASTMDSILGGTWVNIDMRKQLVLENINVWEIDNGDVKEYRISTPGLRQDNYDKRVMVRGKQTERHVLGQYQTGNLEINMYPVTDYLSVEDQTLYLQLLSTNNIRGCIEQLRELEKNLNSECLGNNNGSVKIYEKRERKGE